MWLLELNVVDSFFFFFFNFRISVFDWEPKALRGFWTLWFLFEFSFELSIEFDCGDELKLIDFLESAINMIEFVWIFSWIEHCIFSLRM